MTMRCTALQKRGSKLLKLIAKPAERVASTERLLLPNYPLADYLRLEG